MRAGGRDGVELVALARLLSLGFAPPTEESLAELEALAAGLLERDGAPAELAELAAVLADAPDAGALAGEYEALFVVDARCPPYEGSYERDPFREARQLADVAGFYRAFGAAAGGPAAERPDHAGCELEFLELLAARRFGLEAAGSEKADVCREAEDAFLRDHLGRWLPALCRDVVSARPPAFYAVLARLADRFVAAELARRGLEPPPLPARRPRSAVEGDVVECAAEAAAAAQPPM